MLLATARFVITTIQRKFVYFYVFFFPKVPRSILIKAAAVLWLLIRRAPNFFLTRLPIKNVNRTGYTFLNDYFDFFRCLTSGGS